MPTSLGIVLAIISGLALGVAVLGQYFTSRRVDEAHDAWMAAIAQEHLARGEQHDALMLQFRATQTACTLTERRLLDIQAYAILNNWAIPTDAEHGPLGNLERMKPREAVNARQ
jgi:type II secretory pathway pseudopilin PulG